MNLKNKNVLVYGLGDSGRAVIKVLRENNAYVSFYDDNLSFYDYVGFERDPFSKMYDFVVVSPGVKCLGNKLLENFAQKNILVMSELDFGYLMCKGRIVGITGTNGKTTTSMLTNKILKHAGYETFLCGNIGLPISAIASQTTRKSIVVCEVSNFQLETSRFFRPNIACILNVCPDHLDRHGNFFEYKKIKRKIAQNMKRKDVLILNLDDEEAKYMVEHKNFQYFSKRTLKSGVYVKEDKIFIGKKQIADVKEIKMRGEKNLENVLASLAICSHFKVKKECIAEAISNFMPASHRMEIVGTIEGVVYVDDSKATNVASTVACVEAFRDKDVILLLGGKGKGIDYSEIFEKKFCIREVVCFGEERDNIENCARKFDIKTSNFGTLFDATKYAIKIATDGDYVLLSPACSSFDEFSNYQERGEKFKEIVLGCLNE